MVPRLFSFCIVFLFAINAMAEDNVLYKQVSAEYPEEKYIIGIGEKKISDNSLADKRIVEVLARRDIAIKIRVHIEEETIDMVCEGGPSKLFDDKTSCKNMFSMKIIQTVDEFLVSTRIVKNGEKNGTVYAVAVMPRAEVVEKLDNNIRGQIDKTKSSIAKARQGDRKSVRRARDEYMKAVLFVKERDQIEGVKRSGSKLMSELEDEIKKLQDAE